MSNRRVLMVDDEQRVLDGLRRMLRGRYELSTSVSGAEAIGLVRESTERREPFAVVVSDMQMPVVNGAALLASVNRISPDTVLMILSGQADMSATIAAVNNSSLFRFLTKPCGAEDLTRALDDALRQYELLHAERDLLERTLNGAVEVLSELLSSASPVAAARGGRVRALVDAVAEVVEVADGWEVRLASLLSQVGCVSVPEEVLRKVVAGEELAEAERALVAGHPNLARTLLGRVPRLERVAAWVGAQPVELSAARAPLAVDAPGKRGWPGELVFATAVTCLLGVEGGVPPEELAPRLTEQGFPAALVSAALGAELVAGGGRVLRSLGVDEIMTGHVLDQDVLTTAGVMLLRKGEPVTDTLLIRLKHYARTVGVEEPIQVLC